MVIVGFKKRLKYQLLENGIRKTGAGRLLKRIMIAVVAAGLIFLISGAALVGYGVNRVNKMMAAKPDADIVALEQLVTRKVITLTGEQKAKLTPLIRDLAKPEQLPEQAKALKEQLWSILEPEQLKMVRTWQVKTEKEAGALAETGGTILSEAVSKYTGISAEQAEKTINSLSGWWQLNAPQKGSVDNLLKEVEGK